jgi:hypothetical protein
MTRVPGGLPDVRTFPGHGTFVLFPAEFERPDGHRWRGWEWDLSGIQVPPGATRGDPNLQRFGLSGPQFWYVDRDRTCVACGDEFVFAGAEQRFWYETLGFDPLSTAIRCPACRRKVRSLKALHATLATALRAAEAAPDEAARWLDLARACGELRDRTGEGDLDRGLAAARRARRLSDDALVEALYWEATFQRYAGRLDAAAELEAAFIARAGRNSREKALLRAIERRGRASPGE